MVLPRPALDDILNPMRRLKTLLAWRLAVRISDSAYGLTMRSRLERHRALCDQVRRSALSIPANIAEGYALGTKAQFVRCLRISLGSASELNRHLRLARKHELIHPSTGAVVIRTTERFIGVTVGLLKHLGADVPKPRPRRELEDGAGS